MATHKPLCICPSNSCMLMYPPPPHRHHLKLHCAHTTSPLSLYILMYHPNLCCTCTTLIRHLCTLAHLLEAHCPHATLPGHSNSFTFPYLAGATPISLFSCCVPWPLAQSLTPSPTWQQVGSHLELATSCHLSHYLAIGSREDVLRMYCFTIHDSCLALAMKTVEIAITKQCSHVISHCIA